MALTALFRSRPAHSNEHSLAELFDSLEDVVLRIGAHDQLQYVNRCWSTLTGVSREHSLQRTLLSFIHPEDTGIWQQAVADVAESRHSQLIWLRMISADEDIRWCEMRLQSMHADSLYPLSATLCDITPQVRADQVKNASHRSLNGLVSSIPAMIYRSRNNLSWTMEYVSDGCETVTGYKAAELMDQPQLSYGSVIDPQDAGAVWQQVQEALAARQPFELKYRICDASGKRRTVLEKGCGIYAANGQVLGVQGVIFNSGN